MIMAELLSVYTSVSKKDREARSKREREPQKTQRKRVMEREREKEKERGNEKNILHPKSSFVQGASIFLLAIQLDLLYFSPSLNLLHQFLPT
jgi:hypothetical protein